MEQDPSLEPARHHVGNLSSSGLEAMFSVSQSQPRFHLPVSTGVLRETRFDVREHLTSDLGSPLAGEHSAHAACRASGELWCPWITPSFPELPHLRQIEA